MKQTSNDNPHLLKEILLILNDMTKNRYIILTQLSQLSQMIYTDRIFHLHKLLLDRYLLINSISSLVLELLTPEYIYDELNSTHLILDFYNEIHELEMNIFKQNDDLLNELNYLVIIHTGIPIPVTNISNEIIDMINHLIDNETNIINQLKTIENQAHQLNNYKNKIIESIHDLYEE